MPCWTTTKAEIDFGKADAELMQRAIAALGIRGEFNAQTGKLTLYGKDIEQQTKQVKQSYGAEVVKAQAKKFGWSLKEISPFKYEVLKR